MQNRRANIVKVSGSIDDKIPIPANYGEAIKSPHCQGWINAMDDEMKSLVDNEVYEESARDQVNKRLLVRDGFSLSSTRRMDKSTKTKRV